MPINILSASQSGYPLRNIHISNNNRSVTFYVDVFFPQSLQRLVSNLTLYVSNTAVSYQKRDLLTLREHTSSPPFFCKCPCSSWFKFLLCPMMCLHVLNSVLWNLLRFRHKKQCSVRLYLQLFVGGLMSFLRLLCLLTHSGIKHILCCLYVLFFFVLCTIYCHVLWIVHVWLYIVYFVFVKSMLHRPTYLDKTFYKNKRWICVVDYYTHVVPVLFKMFL